MCRCGPTCRAGAAPGVAPRRRGTPPSRGHPSSSRKIFSRIVAFGGIVWNARALGVELGCVSSPIQPSTLSDLMYYVVESMHCEIVCAMLWN